MHSGEKGPHCHDGGPFLTTVFCPFPPSLFSLILLEFKHKLNFFGPLLTPVKILQAVLCHLMLSIQSILFHGIEQVLQQN